MSRHLSKLLGMFCAQLLAFLPMNSTTAQSAASSAGAPAAKGPLQQGASDLQFSNGVINRFSLAKMDSFVIVPAGKVDPQRRWVWVAPMWLVFTKHEKNPLPTRVEYEFYVESLLAHGFHVAGVNVGTSLGSPASAEAFDKFYEFVINKYQLNPKARLIGQSQGGLMAYGWAFRHPEKVDRILGIYPALDLRSWPTLEKVVGPKSVGNPVFGFQAMSLDELKKRLPEFNPIDNLKPLADAKVKIFHIHGDSDHTVPFEPNSGEALRRYRALGGDMEVLSLPGKGHDPGPGFYGSQKAVDFLIASLDKGASDSASTNSSAQ